MVTRAMRRAAPFAALAAASAAALASPPVPARADPAPDGRFRAMVERPLFSPTRRPPAAPPAPLDAPAPAALPLPPPDLTLSGVITGGGSGIALVRRPQDAAPIHVALGGTVDGWTVAEIRPRAIVLTRDARSVTVGLPTPAR